MNIRDLIRLWVILSVALGIVTGCANYDPHNNPVSSVAVTGGGNAQIQDWHAGITITFKTPPPDFVITDLLAAGGRPAPSSILHPPSSIFILPLADALDPIQQKAIASALTVPGTLITGHQPSTSNPQPPP